MSYKPYENTANLKYGELFVFPDVPGAAGVQNGCVGVWTRGTHADYWHERKATAEEIVAFDAAKARAQQKTAAAAATQPAPLQTPSAATTAAPVVTTATPSATAGKTDWAAILARAEQSGEMTDELRAQGLRLLANPSAAANPAAKPAKPATPIDTAAIYAKRANMDDVIAKLDQRL